MTPHVGEPKETDALDAVMKVARNAARPPTQAQLAHAWHGVSVRLTARKARRRFLLRSSLVGATAAACVLFGLGVIRFSHSPSPRPPALAYQIEGGSVIDGGYLRESGNSGLKLFFAEGTEFILMPGARGRLRSVDSLGAHIAIEQGSASFQVTPRNEARWLVDVGPFLVTVKGTVFTVSWDAVAERFELRLRHGRVSVSGPLSGGEVALRAGQRLVVNLPKAETLIAEQPPEEAWLDSSPAVAPPTGTTLPQVAPASATERPAGRPAGPAVPNGKLEGERRWAQAVAAGKWDLILADVERAGVKPTLEKASSEDLFALADAARYRRRTTLARETLLAERRRFPQSTRALDAAFLLGRLEESHEHAWSKALAWYDDYLAHASTGTYASEALGRKMIVTNRLEGAARAQPIAEEYLRRFPNGTYAGTAQALRNGP